MPTSQEVQGKQDATLHGRAGGHVRTAQALRKRREVDLEQLVPVLPGGLDRPGGTGTGDGQMSQGQSRSSLGSVRGRATSKGHISQNLPQSIGSRLTASSTISVYDFG